MYPVDRSLAFGGPGIEPRWTRSDKQAVGTAYSVSSRVWFTLAAGIVSEVYYPTIDRPQIRDLQYLITDGENFFHDERRHVEYTLEQLPHALGYRLHGTGPEDRYRITKEIITDPHYPCLLVHTRFEAPEPLASKLRLFVLLAPHLEGSGRDNSGYLAEVAGYNLLMATKGSVWLALTASNCLTRRSCGYVGASDAWTDLADNFQMDWEFETAPHGNIALAGEIDLANSREFTLAMAFGTSEHHAQTTLVQSLGVRFEHHRERFIEQWQRVCGRMLPLEGQSGDGGALYHGSHALLLAHEDKSFPGATIASLSIPWGESKGDEDLGGYHLVWPRDMVHTCTALLASGNHDLPYRSLIYLACTQARSGGFFQNFWIDGEPFWSGVQLDQVSFAILLAWRVSQAKALFEFDPWPMVVSAARFLIREGPATAQERWEENSGYSPSTLAANIAALTCAALFAKQRGEPATAEFLHEYADFLERHLEGWTVTNRGSLVPGISRHYIRILPIDMANPQPDEDPERALVLLKNQAPGAPYLYPARDIVDAGFLELVRYGIRPPGDPLIEDSLKVVDQVLRVETPRGPCFRRYNHDGYGQRDDGGPFDGWGVGRAWPLLCGERGHYELAAGRDPMPYLRAMERFAHGGLLAEQVWELEDRPADRIFCGRPTGAAMPLVWAHAEYITLLRSMNDGKVFDLLPGVAARYQSPSPRKHVEIWKANRHQRSIRPGATLRVLACSPFLLHSTGDEWQHATDTLSTATPLGIHFVDLVIPADQRAKIRFTQHWTHEDRWEGRDYSVDIDRSA
jgi:glucoamylase